MTARFFASAAKFRDWLNKHSGTAEELIVGYYKVGSGRASMTWPESVDEALCAGWIDGVRKRIDELAYQIRFTPRRATSIWSSVNITRAEALMAQGRMSDAGLAAYGRRSERKTGIYAYEQSATRELSADEIAAFQNEPAAWAYFESAAPSYRKTMLHWVVGAKQAATRARRLTRLIECCAEGRRMPR